MLDTIKVCLQLTSQKNLAVKGWMKYHSFTLALHHTFSPIFLHTQNFNFRQFFLTLSLPLQLVTPSILPYNIPYTQSFLSVPIASTSYSFSPAICIIWSNALPSLQTFSLDIYPYHCLYHSDLTLPLHQLKKGSLFSGFSASTFGFIISLSLSF